jgi:hypothetical protein
VSLEQLLVFNILQRCDKVVLVAGGIHALVIVGELQALRLHLQDVGINGPSYFS